jgi:hypothetical protein
VKYYSLFFIIIFIPVFGYTQDSIAPDEIRNSRPGFSVSLQAGLSPGFGHYYEDGLEEDGWMGGECAAPGIAMTINCDYRFKRSTKHNLELTASVGYAHNNYEMSDFINEEYNSAGDGWPASKLVTNTSSTGYNTGYFSAGIKYPWYLKRFTLYFDIMAGFLVCQTPAISFTERYTPPSSDSVSWRVTQRSQTGFAYTISIGLGIEYHINKNIFVLVTGGLGVALNTINVSINSAYPSYITNLPRNNYYSDYRIQLNNLEMGIGYEF